MKVLHFLTPQLYALPGFYFYNYDTLWLKSLINLLLVTFRVGVELLAT